MAEQQQITGTQHITRLLKRLGFMESTYREETGWSRGLSLYCDGSTIDVEAWEYPSRAEHEKAIDEAEAALIRAYYTVSRVPCHEGTYLVVSKNAYFDRHSRLKQAA